MKANGGIWATASRTSTNVDPQTAVTATMASSHRYAPTPRRVLSTTSSSGAPAAAGSGADRGILRPGVGTRSGGPTASTRPAGAEPVPGPGAVGPGSGPPLVFEHGVHQLVPPGPLEQLVLDEAGLTAHPQPLHHPRRGQVQGVAAPDHPVQPQPLEPQSQHRLGRLGGQPPALVSGMEH